jgi:hypothetical protein
MLDLPCTYDLPAIEHLSRHLVWRLHGYLGLAGRESIILDREVKSIRIRSRVHNFGLINTTLGRRGEMFSV